MSRLFDLVLGVIVGSVVTLGLLAVMAGFEEKLLGDCEIHCAKNGSHESHDNK